MTDYYVDAGTVAMIGGANTEQMVRFCVRVGLLTKARVDGLVAYKLVDDPEFIHIRLRLRDRVGAAAARRHQRYAVVGAGPCP
jgi:hypothetical protein